MQYLFDSKIYSQRRKSLKEKVNETGVLLFLTNGESPMNYTANTFRYRQDSNFLYFFGLNMPNIFGAIDLDSGEEILFGDDPSIDDIVWTGPVEKILSLANKIGINKVRKKSELSSFLKGKKVHYLPPYRHANIILLSELLSLPIVDVSNKSSSKFIEGVIALRSVKSAEEIVQMELALTTTKVMHEKVMRSVSSGMKESALTGIARGIAIGNEGDVSYPIILSKDGQTLHNHGHHNILQEGQIVLADMGAENRMCYAADITRTFPVSKTFTSQQKDIYRIVLEAEESSIKMCKPGIAYADVHQHASLVIAKGLTALGLMKGDPIEAVNAGAHAMFFPHGLGHMIGLDVHDMEDLGEDRVGYDEVTKRSDQFGTKYLRLGKKLNEGFVITVEPGIYFIPELIDQCSVEKKYTEYVNFDEVNKWKNFGGIRIEDNVLITKDGQRILGPPIAKGVDEVESLRNK